MFSDKSKTILLNFVQFLHILQPLSKKIIEIDMLYLYNDKKIFYRFHNHVSRSPVLLLHGWGCDGDIFKPLIERFPEKSFLTVDFPPFGRSEKIIADWNIFTYVGMLMSLCEHLHIDKCDVLGHSFGGRIAIILAAVKRSLVQSCILVDSAGMKPKRSLKFKCKQYSYQLKKAMGRKPKTIASPDYLALDAQNRSVFSSIVSTHLEEYCQKISRPTLIIWGEKDSETPLYMAKRMQKKIRNSTLQVIDGAGHYSFLDRPLEFTMLVSRFWEEEKCCM